MKEGEASLMQRNQSVADSEKSKCRRCSDRYESFVLATIQVLSVMVIDDITDLEKSKRRRCSDRCESFVSATIQVLFATVIGDVIDLKKSKCC